MEQYWAVPGSPREGGRSFVTVKALATDEEFAAASHHHPVFHLT
jgi:hypothetical protein